MSRHHRLAKLPEEAISQFLGDRPRDPRVKYTTGIPKGKVYPTAAQKREREAILAEVRAKEGKPINILVTDENGNIQETEQ